VVYAQSIPLEEGAFTDFMARTLRQQLGDIPVSVKGTLTLSVGLMQANLERSYSICRNDESSCAAEVTRYVKGVSQVIRAQNAPIDKAAVRLVIRSSEYIKRAQASFGNDGPTLQVRPLVEGLVSVAVLDTPRAVRPLDDRDLKKLEVSQEQLFEIGAKNLRGTLKPLAESAKPAIAGQIGTLAQSFYEVGRVALLSDWEALASAQSGTLLVALPTTDTVLYISESSPASVDALRTLARSIAMKSPSPLSAAVLRWTKERWELVP
jgi:uncharacterized protein YtpQ (UPF0354 family)